MKKHFFVETETGTIFEILYYGSMTGDQFDLDTIEDFDDWARDVIHLSKVIDKLPESLQGFLMGDRDGGEFFPKACSLSGARRAWMEEW